MKVVVPKQQLMTTKVDYLPLIPDKELDALTKDNSIGFSLKTSPANAASSTYKVNARILQGGESVRVMLRWKREVERVCYGLAAATIDDKVRIAETLMRDTPLTLFQASIMKQAETAKAAARRAAANPAARTAVDGQDVEQFRHLDHFQPALNFVLENLMPKKVLQYVKRNLRRNTRKPKDLKVRMYFQHITRINTEEIPALPPFADDQELRADEIIEVLLYGTPKSWQREMDRQGFNPIEKTPAEVVAFMEQVEAAEDFEGQLVEGKPASSNGNNKKSSSNKDSGNTKGSSKYCALHGKGNHSTDDCRTIKSEVKKLKSNDSKPSGTDRNVRFASKNKTWSKKAEDYKQKSQKELNAMGKVVEKLKKEVNALTKKRKSEDSDEEELHAVERQLEAIDMNGFDIEDLKKSMGETDPDEIST
jgi:hypothetical protein